MMYVLSDFILVGFENGVNFPYSMCNRFFFISAKI